MVSVTAFQDLQDWAMVIAITLNVLHATHLAIHFINAYQYALWEVSLTQL
jgi:hypothetical protein